MCGILGCVVKKKKSDNLLKKSLNYISHRGPDCTDFTNYKYNDFFLYLGHTRLSIIELKNTANQPFISSCGNYAIIFNGEIYNYKELRSELKKIGYKFKTESDTEVLLNTYIEWGQDCLTRLIGMFSFAFFDYKKGAVTLVRDAFGVKPFFYSIHNNELYFGSELQALCSLQESKIKPNLQTSYNYLVHGDYDSTEDTFLEGIKHLLPAHLLIFDLKKNLIQKPIRWWKPNFKTNTNIKFNDAVKRLRKLFLDSVRLHLRSDVPLGFTLSGGVDSSAIVSAARFIDPELKLNTFSYIDLNEKVSEEKWIDLINKKMNTISHKTTFHSNDLVTDLNDIILRQGEPFSTLSIYAQYKVFKLAKENGIKVILDGQGADELLSGYSGYPGQRLLSIIETKGWWAAHKFAKNWSKYPGRNYILAWMYFGRLKFSNKIYKILRKFMGRDFEPTWLDISYLKKHGVNLNEKRQLLTSNNKGLRVKEALANSLINRGLRSLLRHEDRNSMKFSIENRVPFLTIPLANFLLSLPEEFLISYHGITKNIFREAMRGIMPDSHIERKDKIGFEASDYKFLLPISGYLKKLIENSPDINFINKKELLREFDQFVKGSRNFDKRFWRWINYLYWYKLYIQK